MNNKETETMKNTFLLSRIFVKTVLVAMLFAATVPLSARAQDIAESRSPKENSSLREDFWWLRKLEGTWQAQTTIVNCQTGTVMENFAKLVSFNASGTAQEVSSSTLFRSAALGVWDRDDRDSFRYLLRFFRFNPDGTPAGSVRAIWEVNVAQGSDSYTGEATVQIIAPNGTVVATICGTETATRLELPD
jgi:hypothetical protein